MQQNCKKNKYAVKLQMLKYSLILKVADNQTSNNQINTSFLAFSSQKIILFR